MSNLIYTHSHTYEHPQVPLDYVDPSVNRVHVCCASDAQLPDDVVNTVKMLTNSALLRFARQKNFFVLDPPGFGELSGSRFTPQD